MPKSRKPLTPDRELYLAAYIATVKAVPDTWWVATAEDVHYVITMDDGVEDVSLADVRTVWNKMVKAGYFNGNAGFQFLAEDN